MRRLGLLLVLVVIAVGCTGGGDDAPTPADPTSTATATAAPVATEGPTTPPTTAPTTTPATQTSPGPQTTPESQASDDAADGAESVQAFYAREAADTIWVEPVTIQLEEPTVAVAAAAVTALLEAPAETGLVTLAPEGTELLGVDVADGLLTVDLSAQVDATGQGSAGEVAFQQQLAHTGTQFPTVDEVQLLVEGQTITDLWGHLDWSEPFTADEFALSPIIVTDVGVEGRDVTLAGTANVFEATIELVLADAEGTEVAHDFATATCGTGCRGDWSHTFTVPDAGQYTVTAIEPDPSGGEGRPPFAVATTVEVG